MFLSLSLKLFYFMFFHYVFLHCDSYTYMMYVYTPHMVFFSCSTMCLYCYICDNALGEPWCRYRLHSGFICSYIYFWRIGYVYIINYLENYNVGPPFDS